MITDNCAVYGSKPAAQSVTGRLRGSINDDWIADGVLLHVTLYRNECRVWSTIFEITNVAKVSKSAVQR